MIKNDMALGYEALFCIIINVAFVNWSRRMFVHFLVLLNCILCQLRNLILLSIFATVESVYVATKTTFDDI